MINVRMMQRGAATLKLARATRVGVRAYAKQATHPDPAEDSVSAQTIKKYDPFYVPTYSRPGLVLQRAKGSHVWDLEDRKYIDFTAGIAVNALGHANEEVAKIIYDQATTVMHVSNLYFNEWTGQLNKLLVEKTVESGGMKDAAKLFLCNSGSEANEAAIKFARKYAKYNAPNDEVRARKHEIVSFANSFHGRTMGSLSATPNPKYQAPFSPMVPGFKYATYNDMASVDAVVSENTCAVIIEPIQGEGGVFPATEEFMLALRKKCDEVGALLIFDEIQCGLGRTGTFWAHSSLPPAAHPDIVTSAKALGNGFPVGATLVTDRVADAIKIGDHGTTYGGNPLASRVALYTVGELSSKSLLDGVNRKSELFRAGLADLQAKYPDYISEVRGRGLILGVQCTRDPSDLIKAARERGLLVITAGVNTVRIVPPLNIPDEVIADGLAALDDALAAIGA
ncbi:acetylornithine aminotransferase [Dipodascopsis tothii]|uniref:acetylornithine aminotransferase n=1 Tax=Dipodascopsis tothii TaxID=44089 RepID=UPI0034CE13AD